MAWEGLKVPAAEGCDAAMQWGSSHNPYNKCQLLIHFVFLNASANFAARIGEEGGAPARERWMLRDEPRTLAELRWVFFSTQ